MFYIGYAMRCTKPSSSKSGINNLHQYFSRSGRYRRYALLSVCGKNYITIFHSKFRRY
jgi:hypothetical protein